MGRYRQSEKFRAKNRVASSRFSKTEKGRESARRCHLRRMGIDEHTYGAMLREQNMRCAICREESSGFLCVDHDHDTGRVRGLLCSDCNLALGQFKDDTKRLAAAIVYLES